MKFKSLVEARAHQRAISQMVTRAYDEIGAEMTKPLRSPSRTSTGMASPCSVTLTTPTRA